MLLSGSPSRDAASAAKALEAKLLSLGRAAFYLGLEADGEGASLWEGSGLADRLGEAASLLLDAGLILVVSARGLDAQDVKALEARLAPHLLLELEPSSDKDEAAAAEDGIVAEAVARLRGLGAF